MIIQIRGTSGSGKTWVMRRVMKVFEGDWSPVYVDGRKKPLLYRAWVSPWKSLVVLGHYESPCGGCDTIGSARQVFELVEELAEDDVILCEGLLLSEDTKWASQFDLRVVYLHTPIEQCISQIKQRRLEAGNTKPLNEANTRNRVKRIERSRVKLETLGVLCKRVSARQAPSLILKWLQLHA